MMVGAILTQTTNWHNVEQAIGKLRQVQALHPRRLLALGRGGLQRAIYSTGYFRQKAVRLRTFAAWYLARYGGSRVRMFSRPWPRVREELLRLRGIGPETADSILLYAGGKPVFVADAYSQRIFRRHRMIGAGASYEEAQALIMDAFPRDQRLYNEFHALIVAVGKRYCHRRAPACGRCPLRVFPHRVVDA